MIPTPLALPHLTLVAAATRGIRRATSPSSNDARQPAAKRRAASARRTDLAEHFRIELVIRDLLRQQLPPAALLALGCLVPGLVNDTGLGIMSRGSGLSPRRYTPDGCWRQFCGSLYTIYILMPRLLVTVTNPSSS